MEDYSIANTTKQERIELIKSWIPEDEKYDESAEMGMDLFDLYADYINGEKEIAECNAAFNSKFLSEDDI